MSLLPPARPAAGPSTHTKILAAVAYGGVSMGIMVVNKVTMTSYAFPSSSFVGLAQMIFTCVALYLLRALGTIDFPRMSWDVCRKVNPLPLIFVANLVTGLGGTKAISLPMFTVLRRFSIVLTMAGQYFVLGQPSSCAIQLSVWIMVVGAFIAAIDDLAFDLAGYAMIFANDIFTAANGIYIQQKAEAKELGKFGIIFYNALFSMPFLIVFMFLRDQEAFNKITAFPQWSDPSFIFFFSCSCSFGLAITYAIVWCTSVNSALTTTVIGCLKNLVIAYAGMFVGGDYVFSWLNFTGITVSVTGAIVYSFVQFRAKQSDSVTGSTDAASSEEASSAKETELASLLVDHHHGSEDDDDDAAAGTNGGDFEDDDEDGNVSDEEAAFLADDNSSSS